MRLYRINLLIEAVKGKREREKACLLQTSLSLTTQPMLWMRAITKFFIYAFCHTHRFFAIYLIQICKLRQHLILHLTLLCFEQILHFSYIFYAAQDEIVSNKFID